MLAGNSDEALGRTGLVLATTKGDIDAQVAWMRAQDGIRPGGGGLPLLGGEAARLARRLRIGGPAWTVSTACSSGLTAIIDAAFVLLDGDADRVLVAGIDVAGDFVQDGFRALRAISPTSCRPFDVQRDGLALGSGAAACLLARETDAREASCRISGWGMASDAVHMTAPDREARGLIRAMEDALAVAQLAPEQIDVLIAHGTGTPYNDAMEALAIEKVFLQQADAKGPAVTAVKGLIGHTLGASGVVESILAARILETQVVPPVTGLREPENPRVDFVREPRRVSGRKIRHVMKVASGFGGLNAAVVLSGGGGS